MRFLFATLSVVFAVIAYEIYSHRPIHVIELPHPEKQIRKIHDFTLTDQQGAEFPISTYKGKIWLANFFFTSCQNSCPLVMAKVSSLMGKFESQGLKAASISIDPKRDNVQALANYAKKLQLNNHDWKLLRGDLNEVKKITTDSFSVLEPDAQMIHSLRIFLINENMELVGSFNINDGDKIQELENRLNSFFPSNS